MLIEDTLHSRIYSAIRTQLSYPALPIVNLEERGRDLDGPSAPTKGRARLADFSEKTGLLDGIFSDRKGRRTDTNKRGLAAGKEDQGEGTGSFKKREPSQPTGSEGNRILCRGRSQEKRECQGLAKR